MKTYDKLTEYNRQSKIKPVALDLVASGRREMSKMHPPC